ncbi:MAG: PorT family protein [Saprospiraceae bacterium]|nr:PorT family protein [Saprospiraceae bacterium]
MKNIFLIALLVLAGWLQSSAQLENRFSIGPRIGANISNVTVSGTETLTGLAAGLTSTYSINETSGITLDALYSAEGYKSGNNEVHLNYLRIPILYNSFFGKLGEPFRPKIYAGFSPGFLISAENNNSDIKSQYKSAVLDLVGGIGFNYRLANRVWLNIDVRAFLGLNNLAERGDEKNRTIQPSLGIAYGI